jgi:thiol-disulfide isomerase/thioredoxin
MTRRRVTAIVISGWVLVLSGSRLHDRGACVLAAQNQDSATSCKDSAGDLYSPGAIVELRGQLMQCVIGPHWEPVDAGDHGETSSTLDVNGENVAASLEGDILEALQREHEARLDCDTVLNSELSPTQLVRVDPGRKLLMLFWTPTCVPCKPLLAELAAVAKTNPSGMSFLGVVQSANPDVEAPGDWRLRRVQDIMAEYEVGFPTCVHSSNDISRRWRAEGVPLLLLVSAESGVERAALGRSNGETLLREVTQRIR